MQKIPSAGVIKEFLLQMDQKLLTILILQTFDETVRRRRNDVPSQVDSYPCLDVGLYFHDDGSSFSIRSYIFTLHRDLGELTLIKTL